MNGETMVGTDTMPCEAVVHDIRDARGSGFDRYIDTLNENFSAYVNTLRLLGVTRSATVAFIHYTLHGEVPARQSMSAQDADSFVLRYGDDLDMLMLGLFATGLFAAGVSQQDLDYIVFSIYAENGPKPVRKRGA